MSANTPVKVTVWNEFHHETRDDKVRAIYPNGIHEAVAEGLRESGDFEVQTATLDQPEHGLSQEVLDDTDVLIWWGHMAHGEVQDEVVRRVYQRILNGMGFIALHSSLMSKIFMKLMGTTCDIKWREVGEKERIWNVQPGHPIGAGLGEYIEIGAEEMYGEFFDVPAPEQLLFISWFAGGEVFRSGMTWTRGRGKIFYFRPGHETYPTYFNPEVRRVIANAARYVAQTGGAAPIFGNRQPLETLSDS